jgi:Predicted hydrolase (metallo-beta-lactamase superfamily)
MKRLFLLLIIFIGIWYFYLSYCDWFRTDCFKVVFFDVGQGDSILIIAPGGKTILIDGGPDDKVLRGLGEVMPFWWRQIDLMIITHAHDDHTTGLIEVERRYQIKQVLYNNLKTKTSALDIIIKLFKEKRIKTTQAEPGMSFKFDNDCSLNILAASKELNLDENDYSIVTSFNCLNKKILLVGDAGIKIEKELLNQNIDLKSDIFKISHHGSVTANSEAFLKAIKARVVAISVGINNKFNHPSAVILDRLQNLPVDIYRTDVAGTMVFLANNKTIKLIK